jgi:hypothetical protein
MSVVIKKGKRLGLEPSRDSNLGSHVRWRGELTTRMSSSCWIYADTNISDAKQKD